MLTTLSRHVVYPLMDARDPHRRLTLTRELERDQWQRPEVLQKRQVLRLQQTLEYAGRHCEFYRERFAELGFDPSTAVLPGDLAGLPLLSKDDIRSRGAELLSDEFSIAELVESKTGGSTGVALKIYADTQCQATRNAAAMRSDGWAGWQPGTRIAALWGNPPRIMAPRPWLRNALYERLIFLDTMNMTPATMSRFVRRCNRETAYVLYGHAHSLFLYADFIWRARLSPRRPAGIISTSMMLLESERRIIEEVFETKVSNRYGCEEVGLIASECERHSGMHINVDHVLVEILDEDCQPVPDGTDGQIVVTDLANRGQPLIRYALGDRAIRSSRVCECGRGLPLLERVTGRIADFLVRRDGSRVAGISMIERTLTLVPGLKQLQIVQTDIDAFVLKVVPDVQFSPESESQLREEFHGTFGAGVRLNLERVDTIPRLPSGKYRFSICQVKPERLRDHALGGRARA